jgi:hypothetical protein
MADENNVETWKNPTEGRVWVNRLDHRGEPKRVEIIGPGRTFHVTPAERRLNQEMASSSDLDIFTNGTLTPIRLLGTDEAEAAAFATNPNLMTEGDMRALVAKPKRGAATDAFAERLGEIRNGATLQRLLALAREEDAPLSRVEAIEARLAEVAPGVVQERVTTTSSPVPASAPAAPPSPRRGVARAVTPS